MPPIIFLSIDAVKLPHATREVGIRGFYHKVIMVVHQTVGMTQPVILLNDGIKHKKKILPVLIANKYLVPCISTRGHVVNGIWIFYS